MGDHNQNQPRRADLVAEIRACLLLAIPLAGAQLAQVATAFFDTIMMGLLGSQALAAGGLGAIFFSTLLLICTGVISAVGPLTAEAYGAGQIKVAGRVACQGFWLAAVLTIPCVFLIWQGEPILRQLGQSQENAALAATYLRAIAWGFFPGLAFASLKNFVSALSHPRVVMAVMVGGVGLNIALNYVLMFGKLGLPALGLAGVGWASTCAYWLMLAALISYLILKKELATYEIFRNFYKFDRAIFQELIRVGWAIGVLFAVESGLFTITAFFMGYLGTVTLAAHQIAGQTAYVTFMVPAGISQAITIRVGQLMGQSNPKAARLAGYIGLAIGGIFMAFMALLVWTMPEAIISLYLDTDDPNNVEVVKVAVSLLEVAAMFQLFDGIQVIAAGALRGLKDTRIPMLIGLLAYWCIGLTSGYIMGFRLNLGGVGLWGGLVLGLAVASIVLTWRFHGLISPLAQRQDQRTEYRPPSVIR